ncbi:MAG: hypothetical protein B6244_12765 [Candidatus Cloacimonetes bacterium 4572_55]|nr:MAG: hypothetical protein B6244_12765 [Candidatus Cloacimonetes bacterium 4572_55]
MLFCHIRYKKHAKKKIIIVFIFSLIFSAVFYHFSRKDKKPLHIALVGPLSGKGIREGRSLKKAVELYLSHANSSGGAHGREIVLDVYDNQDNQELAKEQALEIARQNRALAVIGHGLSSCSISAGEVYKEIGVPAITPTSTNIYLTKNNPWYFRAIFDDNLQSRFLAYYVKAALRPQYVTIIQENKPYGSGLASVFKNTVTGLDVPVRGRHIFNVDDENLNQSLIDIVDKIQPADSSGVIFLATHIDEGSKLIKLIKDAGIDNPILTPDNFNSWRLLDSFSMYPKEKHHPGFYTDNLYVVSPLIYDSANEKARRFRELYRNTYGEEPDWRSAFAYDAAMLVVEAIRMSDIDGNPNTVTRDREKIRDTLAGINNIDIAIEGATGYNYFNQNGDAPKPITIGVYKNKNVIPSRTQLQSIRDINEILDLDIMLKKRHIVSVDTSYMYKTDVVYTGLEMDEIRDLNLDEMTCELDMRIWFRYQGDLPIKNIKFLNAPEPIDLGDPIYQEDNGSLHYRLYRIKDKFQIDFLPDRYAFRQNMVGISFRHLNLTHNNLIYVVDLLGMGMSHSEATPENMKSAQTMGLTEDWTVNNVFSYQTVARTNSLGKLKYLNLREPRLEFSQFNYGIRLKKKEYTLRGLITPRFAVYLLAVSVLMIFLYMLEGKSRILKVFPKSVWFIQTIFAFTLLLSTEVVVVYALIEKLDPYYLELIVIVFNISWWTVPAIVINSGIERFLWIPLEIQTGRLIPKLVRHFLASSIQILSIFGIIAFVFDQKVTGLLATSGMVAMIIGLAIQVNISNIFSGIAINLERPFRVGDWVKIGNYEEGKVIDVTWRTTRIQTWSDCILSIPNSSASESSIHNYSYPDDLYWMWPTVHIDRTHPPALIKKILEDAAMSVKEVLDDPQPMVFTEIGEWSVKYIVAFCVKNYEFRYENETAVWEAIWVYMDRAGISFGIPERNIHITNDELPKNNAPK